MSHRQRLTMRVSMISLWKMHRWAVFLYTDFAVVTQVLVFAMGVGNFTAILCRHSFRRSSTPCFVGSVSSIPMNESPNQ